MIVWTADRDTNSEPTLLALAFDQARRLWREWRERRRYDAAVLTVEVERRWL